MSASATLVEPAFAALPALDVAAGDYTLGPEVSEFCDSVGFTPDPEQDLALNAIFAYHADDIPLAFEACVVAPRQNIKTGLQKQCALGWSYLLDVPLVVWSAHEFKTSAETFLDVCELIEGSSELSRLTKSVHAGKGNEGIELVSGSRIEFRARMRTTGRGLAGTKVILDEAFALVAAHIGSLMPIMSTRPRGQILYGSSAGLIESEVLRGIRDRGRLPGAAVTDPRLAYLEWCDDLGGKCAAPRCKHSYGTTGCILDDELRWARANTQLGRRISYDYVRNERRAMATIPHEFMRERLGYFDDPPKSGGPYGEAWAACLDPDSEITGKVHFALAVANERDAAAIAVAGKRADGLVHVEVIHHDRGTDWAIGVLQKLREKWGIRKVMLDKQSAAASLITDLEAASFEVDGITTAQYAQACGRAFDAVTAEAPTLRHIGQPELDTAVDGTSKRDIGDAYGWDRKEGTDITPHDAATIAAWGVSRPALGGWVVGV